MEDNFIKALNGFLKSSIAMESQVSDIQKAMSELSNIEAGEQMESLKERASKTLCALKEEIKNELKNLDIEGVLNEANKGKV